MIRLSQVPVGGKFKYEYVEYIKLEEPQPYRDNVVRVSNGKTKRLNGNVVVELL